MSNLLAARAQMGTSLAFHIIFAALGVGLPLLLCIAEGLALRKKDATWVALARQWAKAFAILFAIGAVSGVIIEFELSLLWPTFTKFSGAIIGLPFALVPPPCLQESGHSYATCASKTFGGDMRSKEVQERPC